MIRTAKLYDSPDGPRLDGHEELEKQHKKRFEKPIVPDVSYDAGMGYAIALTVTFLKEGIDKSRRAVTKKEGRTSLIHSYKTLKRYVGIMNHFKDTVLVDVKHIHQITEEHVETYFDNMVNDGKGEKTVKVNASALSKLFNAFSRHDLIAYIDENRLTWAGDAIDSNRTTPFGDPDRVIDKMREKAFKAAATIQLQTGARVSDIKKVVSSVIAHPSLESIIILKSKGGRDRELDFSDRMVILNVVLEAAKVIQVYLSENNNDWSSFKKEYTKEVRRAAVKAGEIYCGTHAFRANYANERYEKGIEEGEDEDAVLKRITEDMGHRRISMAKYYLTNFRKT